MNLYFCIESAAQLRLNSSKEECTGKDIEKGELEDEFDKNRAEKIQRCVFVVDFVIHTLVCYQIPKLSDFPVLHIKKLQISFENQTIIIVLSRRYSQKPLTSEGSIPTSAYQCTTRPRTRNGQFRLTERNLHFRRFFTITPAGISISDHFAKKNSYRLVILLKFV